jgi:hypothetical protein
MFKSNALKNWLSDVEALEERLEGMKLTILQSLPKGHESIVRSTAGLLKGRIRSGAAYQRRIRKDWKASFSRRAA